MSISNDLKQSLEGTYDIPFEVNSGIRDNEPWFEIVPSGSHETLFKASMIYRNGVRLVIRLQPQKYSANMVRAMGSASAEKKMSFAAFSKTMIKCGAKVEFSINDNASNPSHPETWPLVWNRVSVRVTIMPIAMTNDDMPDYKNETIKWGKLITGMALSLLDIVPSSVDEDSFETPVSVHGYEEGRKIQSVSTRYERNPINRLICLQNKGCKCSVCGFDFEKQYGEIGRDYIHVHHTVPVSLMGEGYVVDPLNDLVPVCPNCHAMMHRTNPPLTVEELKCILFERRQGEK